MYRKTNDGLSKSYLIMIIDNFAIPSPVELYMNKTVFHLVHQYAKPYILGPVHQQINLEKGSHGTIIIEFILF